MALTYTEAAKLSRNPLAAGVLKAIATSDELISVLPMAPVSGESFVYNREKALPSAEFVALDHSSLTESSATFDKVTVPLRAMVTDVDVYNFAANQMGETNAQMPVQLAQKLKAVGYKIAEKAITGAYVTSATFSEPGSSPGAALAFVSAGPGQDSDRHGPGSIRYVHTGTFWQYRAPGDRTWGPQVAVASNTNNVVLYSDNPSRYIVVNITVASATADGEVHVRFSSTTNEPDGLNKLIPSSQLLTATSANGDSLQFDLLDRMIDEMVKVRENRVFIMNSKMKRKFYALARALGGAGIETVNLPGVTSPISVPAYRGIPILQNDNIPSNEAKGTASTLSSVYLVSLGMQGFNMRVGTGGGTVNVDLDPRVASLMGIMIRDIGELESKEARRTRVSVYLAFALGSTLAACRASQLVTA